MAQLIPNNMKRFLFALAITITFSSCKDTNTVEKITEDSNNSHQINPCLIQPLREYISNIETNFVRRDQDSSLIYIIDFWDEYPSNARPFDTVIVFDYFIKRNSVEGYKGCALVDNYLIAVFDKKQIGHQYYSEDALINIPFKYFKPFNPFNNKEYSQKWGDESIVQLSAEKDGVIIKI